MANGENTSIGTLKISAFSNTVGSPLENVSVTISDNSGNLIASGLTDNEGKLIPVILQVPSEQLSLTSPEEPPQIPESDAQARAELLEEEEEPVADATVTETAESTLPFGSFNITAQSPDGETVTVDGTQVYADITSLQNIFFPGQNNDIDIPNPTIMGGFPEKIPESETKRLPFPSGTVVLPKPVVPSIIIVHAGDPSDSSAPNYTVGFKDYSKNVASSEIFATWPREALKANIIAIVSFTLNRVFTEWYRGKGYSFTVTNSTAYDQAFTYGRNIFSDVSDIVDEVFNLYITRPNISQPILAQYSDGIRVIRSGWLSQWGSKELADQGYSALRILQTYYGRDIYLQEAEKVDGIPSSFPGYLDLGSSGQGVRVLQEQLNAISNNFPLIPKLAVDGIYGPKTEEAVRIFQQIFNLPVTGTVNFATWYRISDVYVAVRNLAE